MKGWIDELMNWWIDERNCGSVLDVLHKEHVWDLYHDYRNFWYWSIYLSIYLYIYLSIILSFSLYISINPSIFFSIYIYIYLYICLLGVYLLIYNSIKLYSQFKYSDILWYFYLSIYLSNSIQLSIYLSFYPSS